jgi:4-hydroxybenzoate polyprenyltransferase
LFVAVGQLLGLQWLYYAGVGVAALTLIYQHSLVSAKDFSRLTQMYFMRNGIVSIAMFLFTWMSLSIK